MAEEDKKIETKRLVIFLALCFGAPWAAEIFGVIPMYKNGSVESIKEAAEMISQIMMAPALASLAARLFTREGLAKSGFQLNFSEKKLLFLSGWFGMPVLSLIGAVIYFLIFRENFDANMTGFAASYKESAAAVQITDAEIIAGFKADLLVKFFTAAALDVVTAFGIEWGFRAYLLPKLFRKIGTIPAMLASGLLSGLWYAPLALIGYCYGEDNAGFPVANILAMCIFGTVTGIIYAFLTLRTGSIFPAVFAHSALNVMMPQAAQFTFDGGNFFIGPAPTGIAAGLPLIVTAVFCLVYMHKHNL